MEVAKQKHTPKELEDLLGNFPVAFGEMTFSPLTSGLINETYLVYSDAHPSYILQQINADVFSDVVGLMDNYAAALLHLNAPDYTQLKLVKTKKGASYFSGPQGHWRLVGFLPNTITYDTTNDVKIAEEAGRIIGRFHMLLEHENPDSFVDTIPGFHDLPLRMRQFEEALAQTAAPALNELAAAIDFAKSTAKILQEGIANKLPVRICHNDTKLNNILYSSATKKALCLIDLDTLMAGHLMFDFGDVVRTVVNPANEDIKELSRIAFRTSYFEALVKGLASTRLAISPQERTSLAFGAVLMPFLHGLRAFTDYLNGNKYYKVSYKEQNYDRAKSLFKFSQKALEHLPYMQETIKAHLGRPNFQN